MAATDAMTITLQLHGIRVLEVVEDLPERLVVAVVAMTGTLRCSACGFKTRAVHQTSKVAVRDLPHGGRPTTLEWHRRRFVCRRCATTTLERKAYGFRRAVNHQARILIECAGHPGRRRAARN